MAKFRVQTKARKNLPSIDTDFYAEISEDNSQIHITGNYCNKVVDITFKVGETAEYDSYNLSYLGEIIKITEKSVTIAPQYGAKVRRLSLNEFCYRNYNFDFEEISRQNFETSMYI